LSRHQWLLWRRRHKRHRRASRMNFLKCSGGRHVLSDSQMRWLGYT
jgi:hypothetical protein